MNIVLVEWLDASFQSGPVTVEQLSEPFIVRSVGLLVQETKERISLAQSFTIHKDEFQEVLHIPKLYIINRRDLRCPKFI